MRRFQMGFYQDMGDDSSLTDVGTAVVSSDGTIAPDLSPGTSIVSFGQATPAPTQTTNLQSMPNVTSTAKPDTSGTDLAKALLPSLINASASVGQTFIQADAAKFAAGQGRFSPIFGTQPQQAARQQAPSSGVGLGLGLALAAAAAAALYFGTKGRSGGAAKTNPKKAKAKKRAKKAKKKKGGKKR